MCPADERPHHPQAGRDPTRPETNAFFSFILFYFIFFSQHDACTRPPHLPLPLPNCPHAGNGCTFSSRIQTRIWSPPESRFRTAVLPTLRAAVPLHTWYASSMHLCLGFSVRIAFVGLFTRPMCCILDLLSTTAKLASTDRQSSKVENRRLLLFTHIYTKYAVLYLRQRTARRWCGINGDTMVQV